MLYCYYGSDSRQARKKARETARALLVKKPDAAFRELHDESFNREAFDEAALGGQGLFSLRALILLDGVLSSSDEETAAYVLDRLTALASSENIFILAEGVLPAVTLKKVKKHATKCVEYVVKEKKEVPAFNIFSLADAFARRDKRALWTGLMRARRAGLAPDEITGTLAWQARTILVSRKLSEAAAARSGVKAFPYQKARRVATCFTEAEMTALSSELISVYHAARRGDDPFASLELFALSL